jgi:hypothetical protein
MFQKMAPKAAEKLYHKIPIDKHRIILVTAVI